MRDHRQFCVMCAAVDMPGRNSGCCSHAWATVRSEIVYTFSNNPTGLSRACRMTRHVALH
jgi:hypothetical protein